MTTTPLIMAMAPSTSPRPSSPRPATPPPSDSAPLTTSAPPAATADPSPSVPQGPTHRPATSASTVLMNTVAQFRSEYSRTGHVGAEPDASYRFPVASHSPMNLAYNRVKDFATTMSVDLQQIDRNHAVSFFNFSLLRLPPIGRLSSGGCAQAHPLGVAPKIRADCLQSIRIFYLVCFFSMPSSNRQTFFRWVRASAPTGCSPRDLGRLLAIDSDLSCFHVLN